MTLSTLAPTLTRLLREATETLDPHHQGVHWPDPLAWDGRPLVEQAQDLIPILEAADQEALAEALAAAIADLPTLGSVAEVAQWLRWDKRKVSLYAGRGKLPLPLVHLACGPLWHRQQFVDAGLL